MGYHDRLYQGERGRKLQEESDARRKRWLDSYLPSLLVGCLLAGAYWLMMIGGVG